jgi:RNA polymerase sigma-70 factor, ECF subfamily
MSPYAPAVSFRPNTGFVANPSESQPQSERDIDGRLIDSVLQGRTDAFEDLVVPHLSSLTRFARRRLRDDSEAEDVVQQAVLLALYNIGQFRREASFKTWLSKIAFNEVIHLRRGRAIAAVSPLHQARADKLADPSYLPDMQIQRRQETIRLHRALTRLPEKYRLIIELRDLRELSIAATARSLSLTAAAVKTRHHRARKLLLRSLAGAPRLTKSQ